ncbi:MAG: hypothetical protein KGV56_02280, partial [Gammaproteobacteria bacterium]|nr:hypothetical protein [Gammaproteobacteria bacterium]
MKTKATDNQPIYAVTVKHDNGLEKTFNTTEEHPFFIDGQGWRKASILERGMRMLDKDGKATATIISQEKLDKTDTYNFEVQDFHTYHIGEIGLWVHNAECCKLPHGFTDTDDFKKFGNDIFEHLEKQGYENVQPIMQGSAVTGKKYNPPHTPFDEGRVSDFDIALASSELLEKAKKSGVSLRSRGSRTAPLNQKDLEKLGLKEMADDLSRKYGREV